MSPFVGLQTHLFDLEDQSKEESRFNEGPNDNDNRKDNSLLDGFLLLLFLVSIFVLECFIMPNRIFLFCLLYNEY